MTESETIIKHIEENNNRIENIKFFMSSNPDANIDDCKRNIEILTISNKALEKQIPKKIVKHDKCPVCNNCQSTTWYYVGVSYCEYCGQKLSWESDTD